MMNEQLISPLVPVLMPTDTGDKAIQLMMDNNLAELPLVNDDKYLAIVREDDILEWDEQDAPLSKADFLDYKPMVTANSHPYDAIKLAHHQNLSVIPVVNEDEKYLGCITSDSLLNYIAETSGIEIPGAILVLEMESRQYSLYDIARIFENEDVIIISSHLRSNKQTNKLEVTIKTNRTDVSAVVAALEHNKYKILESYGQQNNTEDIIDRYKLLMNYLNM
jgi:acetoin utilization protein AcuB